MVLVDVVTVVVSEAVEGIVSSMSEWCLPDFEGVSADRSSTYHYLECP